MRRARGAALPALAALIIAVVLYHLPLNGIFCYRKVIVLFSMAVAVVRAQVQQEPFLETTEGTGINITCSHPEIQNSQTIYWYRQLPGRGPELFVSIHKDSKELPDSAGRVWVSADRRRSALWLGRPRRGDAAVYYCAIRGSSFTKLTFGSGTRLSIQPKVTPSPSVYRLTSKDAQGLEMCLITDYSPEKLTLSSAEQHTSAVVGVAAAGSSEEESSYLSTFWARRDELHCAASHEGFGELQGEDPESGASAVCVTGLSLHFRTDQHLNTLSLSQLGLKIILMKGIIFNVLMTVLMWKKKED
ncbi:M1-specific T cell receptor alpha chain-like [Passer domesticus]|uniref:M1-specific T cell receptor alpha chain-like n=1 Tax=Passer domesticus TaxID=48849 RepID=UPI0030FEE377